MPVPPWEWRKAGLVPKFGGERPWPYGAATPAAAATPEEMRIRVLLAVDVGRHLDLRRASELDKAFDGRPAVAFQSEAGRFLHDQLLVSREVLAFWLDFYAHYFIAAPTQIVGPTALRYRPALGHSSHRELLLGLIGVDWLEVDGCACGIPLRDGPVLGCKSPANASSTISEFTRWRLAAGRAPSSTATMANCSQRRLMACWRFLLNPSCCRCSSLARLFWSHRRLCSEVCKWPRRNLVPIFGFMPYVSKEHGWAICGGARLKVSSAYRIPGRSDERIESESVLTGFQSGAVGPAP